MDVLILGQNLKNRLDLSKFESKVPIYTLSNAEFEESAWLNSAKILIIEDDHDLPKSIETSLKQRKIEICRESHVENLKLESQLYELKKHEQHDETIDSLDNNYANIANNLHEKNHKYPNFIHYKTLATTMDLPDIPHAHVVIADQQTNGKGRKNNKWISPKGPIYFTLYYHIDLSKENDHPMINYLPLLQQLSTFSICKAINNDRVKCKWPNDIYVDGKYKVSGCLTKSSCCGSNFVVQIGIGLNTKLDVEDAEQDKENEKAEVNEKNTFLHTLHSLNVLPLKDIDNLKLIDQITTEIIKNIENFDLANFKKAYLENWLHSDEIVDIQGEKFLIVGVDDSGYLRVSKVGAEGTYFSVDPGSNRFDMMRGMILQK